MSIKTLLSNLKQSEPRGLNDHILLIDGMNTFIRNFVMVKTMTLEGHHVGGLYGFLRSLGSLVRTFEPTRTVCVFDGKGSTVNRKAVNPEYKAQRQSKRITNWGMFDTREEELQSLAGQIDRLKDYLNCLPVQILEIEKLEADDIIAIVAQQFARRGKRVTVVSTDRDFLQIVQPNLEVYNPVSKVTVTSSNIQEILGVLPSNYLVVKAITGDQSDNLPGVKGVGIKTLIKEFPELLTQPFTSLESIYNIAEQRLDVKPFYAKLIHNWNVIETNYSIMNLQEHNLSDEEIAVILRVLSAPVNKLQVGAFLRYLEADQIPGPTNNPESWLEIFREQTLHRK
jgi:DNA polymerase-1